MKRIIWNSSFDPNDECWREFLEDEAESWGITYDEMSDDKKYELVSDLNGDYLDDERLNLNIQLNHEILVIADLGLWNGRVPGYKFIKSGNIKDILYSDTDDNCWYSDGYNIRCTATHHDGTNYYLYREVKNPDNITNLTNKIYAGEKITPSVLNYYTKSIAPYVHEVYGWPVRRKIA